MVVNSQGLFEIFKQPLPLYQKIFEKLIGFPLSFGALSVGSVLCPDSNWDCGTAV